MILFGHPTGSPFAHHAALAHFESGWLEGFCVPWMPSPLELGILGRMPGLAGYVGRLSRRSFPPLSGARMVEGRIGEWSRMARRVAFRGRFATEALSYQANDWLMRTMRDECRRASVSAVHSYEDCSEWAFEAARRLGKACIYDLPIGYYPAWERQQATLVRDYADWLPKGGLPSSKYVRPRQKKRELEMADLVLVPSTFVRKTVGQHSSKQVAIAPYGVDAEFWSMKPDVAGDGPLRFIYAGQCSLRKGVPMLLEAWRMAGLTDSTLDLVGAWHLDDAHRSRLPPGVQLHGPKSSQELRRHYQCSDVFVFPSYFEGFGLVILEALACGLPVIATEATAGTDLLGLDSGRLIATGEIEALVESLRWFAGNREKLAGMSRAARTVAENHTWADYRECVARAVEPFAR